MITSEELPPLPNPVTKKEVEAIPINYMMHPEHAKAILLSAAADLLDVLVHPGIFGILEVDPYVPTLETMFSRLRDGYLSPSPLKSVREDMDRVVDRMGKQAATPPKLRPLEDYEHLYYSLHAKIKDVHETLRIRLLNSFNRPESPIVPNAEVTRIKFYEWLQNQYEELNNPSLVAALNQAVKNGRKVAIQDEMIDRVEAQWLNPAEFEAITKDAYDPPAYKEVKGLKWDLLGSTPGMISGELAENYHVTFQVQQKEETQQKKLERKKEKADMLYHEECMAMTSPQESPAEDVEMTGADDFARKFKIFVAQEPNSDVNRWLKIQKQVAAHQWRDKQQEVEFLDQEEARQQQESLDYAVPEQDGIDRLANIRRALDDVVSYARTVGIVTENQGETHPGASHHPICSSSSPSVTRCSRHSPPGTNTTQAQTRDTRDKTEHITPTKEPNSFREAMEARRRERAASDVRLKLKRRSKISFEEALRATTLKSKQEEKNPKPKDDSDKDEDKDRNGNSRNTRVGDNVVNEHPLVANLRKKLARRPKRTFEEALAETMRKAEMEEQKGKLGAGDDNGNGNNGASKEASLMRPDGRKGIFPRPRMTFEELMQAEALKHPELYKKPIEYAPPTPPKTEEKSQTKSTPSTRQDPRGPRNWTFPDGTRVNKPAPPTPPKNEEDQTRSALSIRQDPRDPRNWTFPDGSRVKKPASSTSSKTEEEGQTRSALSIRQDPRDPRNWTFPDGSKLKEPAAGDDDVVMGGTEPTNEIPFWTPELLQLRQRVFGRGGKESSGQRQGHSDSRRRG